VTSHQQETVSKKYSRFNHANKQSFCTDGGGGVRLMAARRLISVVGSYRHVSRNFFVHCGWLMQKFG
jgi:hypothetical protein